MDVGMIIVEQLGARLVEWVRIAKFVFRGSCEMSGSLFRIKNLKIFRLFLNPAHTLLQPFWWKKMKYFHRFVFQPFF